LIAYVSGTSDRSAANFRLFSKEKEAEKKENLYGEDYPNDNFKIT